MIKGFQQTLVKAHKPNIVCLNINVNSVRIKQFKHQISPHINQVNMNESNINVTSVIIKHWIKITNKGAQQVSSWWFIYSLYFWTIKNIIWLFRHTCLFKCEQCDHEANQKHFLNAHKHVGTRYKCNQCDQIEIQWCNLKSHELLKCINYQLWSV